MTERHPSTTSDIDYDLELDRELKRKLRFLIKELELVNHIDEHVDEIIGEIMYIGASISDVKTRAYISRKMRYIAMEFPHYFRC